MLLVVIRVLALAVAVAGLVQNPWNLKSQNVHKFELLLIKNRTIAGMTSLYSETAFDRGDTEDSERPTNVLGPVGFLGSGTDGRKIFRSRLKGFFRLSSICQPGIEPSMRDTLKLSLTDMADDGSDDGKVKGLRRKAVRSAESFTKTSFIDLIYVLVIRVPNSAFVIVVLISSLHIQELLVSFSVLIL